MPTHGAQQSAQMSECNFVRVTTGAKRWRWGREHRDVDPVVVERLVTGDPLPGTSAERREAVRLLHDDGKSQPQIAARLHVHQRQVFRDLKVMGRVDAGLLTERRAQMAERRPHVAALHSAGWTVAAIARAVGVSRQTVTADITWSQACLERSTG